MTIRRSFVGIRKIESRRFEDSKSSASSSGGGEIGMRRRNKLCRRILKGERFSKGGPGGESPDWREEGKGRYRRGRG